MDHPEPTYMWLLVKTADNGTQFFDIFSARELALESISGEVHKDEFWEDASGTLRLSTPDGWTYEIGQEMVDRNVKVGK